MECPECDGIGLERDDKGEYRFEPATGYFDCPVCEGEGEVTRVEGLSREEG